MLNYLRSHIRAAVISSVVVVVAYWFYFFVDDVKTQSLLEFSWRYAIPLVLAATVGLVGERSGVVNIGIEGQMLTSAFAGFFGAAASGSIVVGVIAGIVTGILMGAFLAWIALVWQMDQVIAGVVMNIIATGITSFYYKQGYTLPALMPKIKVPVLSEIPLIGPVFFNRGVFALAALFALKPDWFTGLFTRSPKRERAT